MAVSGYLSALLVAFGAIVSVVGLYALSGWLRRSPGVLQAEPFLGGGASIEHAASRFHLRWYPVTLLFLAFDMEMVVMYPWVRIVAQVGSSAVIEMFVFLAILLTGVGYAYREGALRWT
jgi:NADH-quinone oxidoreductase subunit A